MSRSLTIKDPPLNSEKFKSLIRSTDFLVAQLMALEHYSTATLNTSRSTYFHGV